MSQGEGYVRGLAIKLPPPTRAEFLEALNHITSQFTALRNAHFALMNGETEDHSIAVREMLHAGKEQNEFVMRLIEDWRSKMLEVGRPEE